MWEKLTKWIIKTVIWSIVLTVLMKLAGFLFFPEMPINEERPMNDSEITNMINDANKLLNGTVDDF